MKTLLFGQGRDIPAPFLMVCEITLIKAKIYISLEEQGLKDWKGAKSYKRLKAENTLLQEQNEYLRKCYEELIGVHKCFRVMRHEMANDYLVEAEYLRRQEYDKLEEHYRRKAEFYPAKRRLVDTGNIGMDAILCAKLEKAQQEGIRIELENRITGSIEVGDWDMSTLLGNLIDNSIEAVRMLKAQEQWIRLCISTDETAFFLEISNPYAQSRKKDSKGDYQTLKADKWLHGMGLFQIRRIARKYGGRVVLSDEANIFCAKVFLYMNRGQ